MAAARTLLRMTQPVQLRAMAKTLDWVTANGRTTMDGMFGLEKLSSRTWLSVWPYDSRITDLGGDGEGREGGVMVGKSSERWNRGGECLSCQSPAYSTRPSSELPLTRNFRSFSRNHMVLF